MNALDEGLERPGKRSGLQAVVGRHDRGPLQHAGGVVHVPDADAGRLHRKPHALFGRPQRLDGPIPLGDVADDPHQVAVGERGRDDVRRKHRTVLAPEPPLPVVVGGGRDGAQRRPDVLHLHPVDDVRGMQSDELVARIAEHPADARIGIDVVALSIRNDDPVRRMLEERAVASLARLLCLFRAPALGDVLRHGQRRGLSGEGDGVRRDIHLDDLAGLDTVAPTAGRLPRLSRVIEMREQRVDVLGAPEVPDGHGQELVARVAVALDRGVVDLEEPQRGQVVNPHRQRIGGKQRAELLFSAHGLLGSHLRQAGLLELGVLVVQRAFDAFAVGDVANRAADQRLVAGLERAQADLDGKFLAVLAKTIQVEAGAHLAHAWLGEVAGPKARMPRAEPGRHEHLHRLAEQLRTRVAEHGLGPRVHQHDGAGLVDDDDRIGRRFQEPAEQRISTGRTPNRRASFRGPAGKH